jgi:uncharacterized protein (TIGR00730 family)
MDGLQHRESFVKRICVFAGSSVGARPDYGNGASALGTALASKDIGLVYGGGGTGLMGILADAVLAAGGHAIGIIPKPLAGRELAHSGLSELRVVASMHERKAEMEQLSDAFIALPGGLGTLEEFMEIWTWAQLGIHRKPCGLLNIDGYYEGLLKLIDSMVTEQFVGPLYRQMVVVEESADRLLDSLASYRGPQVRQWIEASET